MVAHRTPEWVASRHFSVQMDTTHHLIEWTSVTRNSALFLQIPHRTLHVVRSKIQLRRRACRHAKLLALYVVRSLLHSISPSVSGLSPYTRGIFGVSAATFLLPWQEERAGRPGWLALPSVLHVRLVFPPLTPRPLSKRRQSDSYATFRLLYRRVCSRNRVCEWGRPPSSENLGVCLEQQQG